MDVATGAQTRVSTGKGRVTCGYFYAGGKRVLYASTHLESPDCPPVPDFSKGYVGPLYEGYDIFTAKADGTDLRRLTDGPLEIAADIAKTAAKTAARFWSTRSVCSATSP